MKPWLISNHPSGVCNGFRILTIRQGQVEKTMEKSESSKKGEELDKSGYMETPKETLYILEHESQERDDRHLPFIHPYELDISKRASLHDTQLRPAMIVSHPCQSAEVENSRIDQ